VSWWSRTVNVFRGERVIDEIDEELHAHIEEAIADGRDPLHARSALGSALRYREDSRDVRLVAWLDSVRADIVFGCRHLAKKKVTSAAAVLSLALAIGACLSAFRLIDALLLRPLPVDRPSQLHVLLRQGLDFDGRVQTFDGWAYPSFRLMQAAVKSDADLLAAAYTIRTDLTFGSDQDIERARVQYVSGAMFGSFGLRPALGRLLTADDDRKLGADPYAVLSYDYWTRRFGRDPNVVGRTFRLDMRVFQVVGVSEKAFTGTEPGTVVDVFAPMTMNPKVERSDQTWLRILARVKPGVALEPLRARLDATSRAFEEERAKGFSGMSRESIDRFLDQKLVLESAAAGASGLQRSYGRSLVALGVLVALVLLIACANVANLMTAQAAAREREMALRVSIGAGRWRLIQLVMVEGALLALLAAAIGAIFAWWSAPFVVAAISTPNSPVRLSLSADWRVVSFSLTLTIAVALLFSLTPAVRASGVRPMSALKSGTDPGGRRRAMHGLIGVQAAFCVLVLLAGGLFVATFERLSNRPLGFSAERILVLDTVAARPQPPVAWEELAERLRAVPGVERVALAGWPLLTANSINGFVSVNGAPPGPVLAFFLNVSPGWIDTMKLRLVEGRDFRPEETSPGAAIVNETFVKSFFDGGNAIGQTFAKGDDRYLVVGVAADVPYRDIREPTLPTAYVPFRAVDASGKPRPRGYAALIVRTSSANPLALAATLREGAGRAAPGFRVSVETQSEINEAQTIRERLLAMVALFFTVVAVVLAGVGLYGVLDYSVLQRRREIGIRVALGAGLSDVVRRVTAPMFAMVVAGGTVGLGLGVALARYADPLFYQVKPTDPRMLAVPAAAMLAIALLAALAPVVHTARIDAATTLRVD
jgi:predicted permease